jgi:nitrogen regulatory protein PII
MQPVKRIEIVTDSGHLDRVTKLLDDLGIAGYTIIRHVGGKGDRGRRQHDELFDAFENAYLIAACSPDDAARVTEALRPILQRFGGMCLVSDAQWLRH